MNFRIAAALANQLTQKLLQRVITLLDGVFRLVSQACTL
jgi:hypothetical protein